MNPEYEGEERPSAGGTAFDRERTVRYLLQLVSSLPHAYSAEDCNRMTLLYFALSGLDLLRALGELRGSASLVDWIYAQQLLPTGEAVSGPELARCGFRGSGFTGALRDRSGNRSGNRSDGKDSTMEILSECPYAESHLAMSYSAICCLAILGDDLARVNRQALVRALRALQCEDGCFRASHRATLDRDIRYVYCACAISAMLNDWSGVDRERAFEYIVRCQTYESAFGQMPFLEAHGGGTYCAIASLALMDRLDDVGACRSVEVHSLVGWLLRRQTSGFQGRVNKEADACYSWWVGASLRLLGHWELADQERLRAYLIQCQNPTGGFSKSPDCYPDLLHTYFSLCGLAFVGEQDLEQPHCALGISMRALKNLEGSLKGGDSA